MFHLPPHSCSQSQDPLSRRKWGCKQGRRGRWSAHLQKLPELLQPQPLPSVQWGHQHGSRAPKHHSLSIPPAQAPLRWRHSPPHSEQWATRRHPAQAQWSWAGLCLVHSLSCGRACSKCAMESPPCVPHSTQCWAALCSREEQQEGQAEAAHLQADCRVRKEEASPMGGEISKQMMRPESQPTWNPAKEIKARREITAHNASGSPEASQLKSYR